MSFIKVAPTWGEYFDSFYSNFKMQFVSYIEKFRTI